MEGTLSHDYVPDMSNNDFHRSEIVKAAACAVAESRHLYECRPGKRKL